MKINRARALRARAQFQRKLGYALATGNHAAARYWRGRIALIDNYGKRPI